MNPAISSFVPPVAPQMPPPQAPASPSSQPGFSQMLSQAQSREAEAPPAETSPEAAPAKPGQPAERATRGDKPAKGEKTTKADAHRSTDKAEGEKTESADEATATEPTAEAPPADPALADWLAALQRPVAPPEAEAGKAAAAGGEEAAAGSALASKGARGAAGGAIAAGKDSKPDAAELAREVKAKGEPQAALTEAKGASSFHAAMAQAEEGRSEIQPAHDTAPAFGAVAASVHTTPGASRSGEVAAPVVVNVPTPATAPEFPQALGVQVSVLAKDGIQHAELHLNPAEMGPISVQIAIDGTQAQVNFGADSAATRQIIESGLPELAASLREAGFTLSGGGVHSQARGREQGEGEGRGERGNGGTRTIGANEKDVTPRRVTSRVSAGGVDLYA